MSMDPVQTYRRENQRKIEHDARYYHIVSAGDECPADAGPQWFLNAAAHLRRLAMKKPLFSDMRWMLLCSARTKIKNARSMR